MTEMTKQADREQMMQVLDYDPNLVANCKRANQTVRLTFGMFQYRKLNKSFFADTR